MKKIGFLFLFFLFSLVRVEAATLHAIVVGHTTSNIGPGVTTDINAISQEAKRISALTGLDLKVSKFVEDDFDPKTVLKALQELAPESEDVILYFHVSHGFRTFSMIDAWPAFDFGAKPALEFTKVAEILQAKGARLTLLFANCCNNYIPYWAAPSFCQTSYNLMPPLFSSYLKEGYRQLFLRSQGVVVAAASKPGQYAWISKAQGGFFTRSFLESLRQEVHDGKTACWQDVMDNTVDRTRGGTLHFESLQEPIYFADVSQWLE